MKTAERSPFSAGSSTSGAFFVRALSVITVLAWILRLLAAWEMSRAGGGVNNMFCPPPTSDLATYMTLGRECAAGRFPAEFYYQPYYYAVFLAPICRIFGGVAVYAVIVIQSLLSAATVFLAGWCGRKVFSERAGLIAAALTAISSSLILYVPFHQNETLQTFHLILLFWLTLRAMERPTWLRWALTGAVAGIAILTRGNVWLLLPAIVIALFLRSEGRRKWAHFGVFVLCLVLLQLPFIIRNSVARGGLCGASTAADAVLALGNGSDAPAGGREPGEAAGAMYYSESCRRMTANAAGAHPRSVPAQMWDFFTEDPLGFLELQFRKALLFWDGREIPNNVSLAYDGVAHSFVLRYLLPGRNDFLLSLGLAGLLWFIPACFRERKRELLLLYGFTLLFYFAVVVFYILSRFKAPVLPFLAIFGGGFLCACGRAWREFREKKAWRPLLAAAIVANVACGVTVRAYDLYRDCEPWIQRTIHPDGLSLDLQGEDIMLLDHGPRPFGGWRDLPLTGGMCLEKTFAAKETAPAKIQIMMRNAKPAQCILRINGEVRMFDLPPLAPGKSERKFVILPGSLIQGRLLIEVLRVDGDVTVTLDTQRNYGRSRLNGRIVDGEWVIRAGIPRDRRSLTL